MALPSVEQYSVTNEELLLVYAATAALHSQHEPTGTASFKNGGYLLPEPVACRTQRLPKVQQYVQNQYVGICSALVMTAVLVGSSRNAQAEFQKLVQHQYMGFADLHAGNQ